MTGNEQVTNELSDRKCQAGLHFKRESLVLMWGQLYPPAITEKGRRGGRARGAGKEKVGLF